MDTALRARALFVAAVILSLAQVGCSAVSASVADTDAGAAFCVAPDRRQVLANTAVTLGLASAAPTESQTKDQLLEVSQLGSVSLEQWRHARPSDYRRACDAVIASARLTSSRPTSFLVTTAGVLLSAIVGAALTYTVGSVNGRRDRRREITEELRESASKFRAEGFALCRSKLRPMEQSSSLGFLAARDTLLTRLQRAQPGRGVGLIDEITAQIAGDNIRRIVEIWPTNQEQKVTRQATAERWLSGIESDAGHIANQATSWRTRKRLASSAPGTAVQ